MDDDREPSYRIVYFSDAVKKDRGKSKNTGRDMTQSQNNEWKKSLMD